ncbi:hypothetical protein V8G54_031334 [Vigna mungo]|uniref:Uncharacterized protein n=1 Tax=Vigna mungo TaxID=3915 RepID=A0AAQ3RKZ6_VIGMU
MEPPKIFFNNHLVFQTKQVYIGAMTTLSDTQLSPTYGSEEEFAIKKGSWTEEEDSLLINYVNLHGEGHWNSLARSAANGQKLQTKMVELLASKCSTWEHHSSRTALDSRTPFPMGQPLPGRTDNEIKNYWRTRVVKQAKQLKCDVNSKQFRDAVRFVWMPRLMERIQASSGNASSSYGNGQTTLCNTQTHGESRVANPMMFSESSMISKYSSGVDVQPPSLSDASTTSSCNLMGDGSCSSESVEKGWQQWDYSDLQAFEPNHGFDDADLWTDENMWFLQQHLADDF